MYVHLARYCPMPVLMCPQNKMIERERERERARDRVKANRLLVDTAFPIPPFSQGDAVHPIQTKVKKEEKTPVHHDHNMAICSDTRNETPGIGKRRIHVKNAFHRAAVRCCFLDR